MPRAMPLRYTSCDCAHLHLPAIFRIEADFSSHSPVRSRPFGHAQRVRSPPLQAGERFIVQRWGLMKKITSAALLTAFVVFAGASGSDANAQVGLASYYKSGSKTA